MLTDFYIFLYCFNPEEILHVTVVEFATLIDKIQNCPFTIVHKTLWCVHLAAALLNLDQFQRFSCRQN